MAHLITIDSYTDNRGSLCAVEAQKDIPFEIKRVFYIYDVPTADIIRGGHRHKKTELAIICLKGTCSIYVQDEEKEEEFLLNNPNKILILNNQDWHTMSLFDKGTLLLVLASEYYDLDDYIDEPYAND